MLHSFMKLKFDKNCAEACKIAYNFCNYILIFLIKLDFEIFYLIVYP